MSEDAAVARPTVVPGCSPPPGGTKVVTKPDGTVITGPYDGKIGELSCRIMSALGGTVATHTAYAEKAVSQGWNVWRFTDNEEGRVDSLWYRPAGFDHASRAPL